MDIAFTSTKAYDRRFFEKHNANHGHQLTFFEPHLNAQTAPMVAGFPVVCCFVNDTLDEPTLQHLKDAGTHMIALRSAGYNHVDLKAAEQLGLTVARVPEYSPYAVAEHAVGLILALDRKIHRAHARVHEGNFSLEGLLGKDLHGQTVGIIGTGKIGAVFAKIMQGFGCKILAYDIQENSECKGYGAEYVPLETLLAKADIISLHCPLTSQTHHMINETTLSQMKDGVMLINTSRGGLIETQPLINHLKAGKLGAIGLDVYEEEADLFFEDMSDKIIQDDLFARLMTFPNAIITSHQAFFTQNALDTIAETTLHNVECFDKGTPSGNELTAIPTQ